VGGKNLASEVENTASGEINSCCITFKLQRNKFSVQSLCRGHLLSDFLNHKSTHSCIFDVVSIIGGVKEVIGYLVEHTEALKPSDNVSLFEILKAYRALFLKRCGKCFLCCVLCYCGVVL